MKTPIEKLEIVLKRLKEKRSTTTGLGAPIHILKEVIDELKTENAKLQK